ncbi:hypothetical protein HOLleu_16358 [Holothuria leucospilota]|uniref:Uncharacterized protein n=1 Tax=Holothuria leucospilota TaxID=206669 RepID=A0A9Q1HAJ8_HOLLE|nr:hypothetical protein HOLleu_16358 [Holothuria leucospilota]
MAIKNFQRHFHLAVKLTILIAVLFPLISGNVCSGNGSVVDTCPEGEYCDEGSCHNCSLCSVNALLQGGGLTKCLCDPTSYKICAIPAPGEQLIEHPKQLSFRNLTGFQNIDFSELKESYNRSSIDCTVPTTPEGPTSAAVTTTSSTTLPPETPKQPSSSTQSATTKAPSPAPENPGLNTRDLLIGIAIGVLVCAAVAIVCFVLYKKYTGRTPDAGERADPTELGHLNRREPNEAQDV